jgi:3-oxoacyl-[acyl-carrier-protein] synthase-1
VGADELWEACLEGRSGVGASGLGQLPKDKYEILFQKTPPALKESRAGVLAFSAANQALNHAGWTSLGMKTGFIFATTTGQIDRWDKTLALYDSGEFPLEKIKQALRYQPLGTLALEIAREFDIQGPQILLTPACSASTQALGLARLWIQSGEVDRVLVGATEILSDLTVEGFKSLRLLASETCRPFDAKRNGINLSEAGVFLCVESHSPRTKGIISGVGFSSDAFHMTAPSPEGEGLSRAIGEALTSAKIKAQEVDWVHAHGTGSQANDLSESSALHFHLGNSKAKISSTKAIHGHALAACGGIESILCLEALQRQTILQTFNCATPDPRLKIAVNLKNEKRPLNHILKTSSGFGGNNCALVLTRSSQG